MSLECTYSYIYFYIDPDTMIPFYIGKGTGNRLREHLYETRENTDNVIKYQKIQQIRKRGKEPLITKIAAYVSEDDKEIYEVEDYLILLFGRRGMEPHGVLANRVTSKNPVFGKGSKHSDETKRVISEKNTGRKDTEETRERKRISKLGVQFSDDHKNRIREAKWKYADSGKQQPIKPETREKLSKAITGIKRSDETRKKMQAAQQNAKNQTWIATSPDGQEYTVTNMSRFCRDHSLHKTCMGAVASGRERQHKGWRCRKVTT